MGAKCCVPVKDDVPMIIRKKYRVPHELHGRRSNRCSPSWSFRVDNRTHIEDTEGNPSRVSPEHVGTAVFRSMGATEIDGFSDGSTSSDGFQMPKWHKSPSNLGIQGKSQSGTAVLSAVSGTTHEITEISESSSPSIASESILTSAANLDSSSSKICSHSADLTSSKSCPLPGHQSSKQISESRVPPLDFLNEEGRQSFRLSFCSNGSSTAESQGGSSSDGWSMRSFSELVVSSLKENNSKNCVPSPSSSPALQTCVLCSKLLKERPSLKGSEIAIAAVLVCGHVYHAECLEIVTPETCKFDPSCPACNHGECSAGKLLVKASRTKNKISRRAIVDIDVNGKFCLERQKSGSCILGASSSGKSSSGRSFLKRHFSFGSRSVKLSPERERSTKKGLWARYR